METKHGPAPRCVALSAPFGVRLFILIFPLPIPYSAVNRSMTPYPEICVPRDTHRGTEWLGWGVSPSSLALLHPIFGVIGKRKRTAAALAP